MADATPNRATLVAAAKHLWTEGLKSREIGQRIGVAPGTVRAWVTRENWRAAAPETKQRTQQLPASVVLADDFGVQSNTVRRKAARVTEHQLDVLMGVQPGKDLGKIHKRGQGIRDAVNAAAMVFGWASQDAVATFAATVKVARTSCQPKTIDVESQNETVEAVPTEEAT